MLWQFAPVGPEYIKNPVSGIISSNGPDLVRLVWADSSTFPLHESVSQVYLSFAVHIALFLLAITSAGLLGDL